MKRIFPLLLAGMICLAAVPSANALEYGGDINPNEIEYKQTFSDMPENHWAFQYVSELVYRKAINGFPDGKYYPNKQVTRAEFAKIMVGAAGLTPTPVGSTGYADVSATNWSAPYVAVAKPYMTSYEQNGQYMFRPNVPALREDIAVAVVKLKGYDTSVADLSALQTMFSDYESISTSIRPYIAVAVERGIISGYPDGTFRGQNTVTRAETAAILWRAFQMGNDDKVASDNSGVIDTTNVSPVTPGQTTVLPGQQIEQVPSQNPSQPATQQNRKKYWTETLASVPFSADDYVFTENGTVYYIEDNKLYQISGGKTTELFDGSTDYYEEMTGAEVAAQLRNNDAYHSSDLALLEKNGSEDLFYFEELDLIQLGYEQSSNTVYLTTETNLQRFGDQSKVWRNSLYNVKNMNTPVFTLLNDDVVITEKSPSMTMHCNRDTLIILEKAIGTFTIDPKAGTATQYSTDDTLFQEPGYYKQTGYYVQVNNQLTHLRDGLVETFNLSTGDWTEANLAGDAARGDYFAVAQNKIYHTDGDSIYRLDSAGTNRLKSSLIMSSEEIDVRDNVPMSSISNFLFDSNGNVVFADEEHNLIRRINKI